MKRRRPRVPPPGPPLAPPGAPERRSPVRVPCVRRCHIDFSDGTRRSAFLGNINEHGAYVVDEAMPVPGQGMTLRFRPPGSEAEIEATGAVAWLNPRQGHAVHGLPPGYGLQFDPLREPARERILAIVREYLARHPRR